MAYELIAAVDLGSNSFRLQVGRVVDDQIYPLDSLKEPVRLASGLTADKRLDAASRERALLALRRFGERLRGFQPEAVRAVATNTLRVAKDAHDFLPAAEKALGFPIEIIGGREEARLIYLGAAHSLPAVEHKRLVVDIGGGSTEFIIGQQIEPLLLESQYMGCVSFSLRFFPGGLVDKRRFRDAELAARREIQGIASDYRRFGWREAVGSSGTARALAEILELNHLNPGGASGITRAGLEELRNRLIRAGSTDALSLDGLRSDRLPVFPGGLAIMCAIFAELDIETMIYADGALRLGVLYDLLGRFHRLDMRDSTVSEFMRRYQVDVLQAARVERTAQGLLGQLRDLRAPENESALDVLRWAVRLHEIGISIAHSGYHKHGAYIVTFADMPGFSKKDQALLALLILGQRGKLEKIAALPPLDDAWQLVFCLRLAALLHRPRDDRPLPPLTLKYVSGAYQLDVPAEWLAGNPLTAAALADEAVAWERIGSGLRLRRRAGNFDG
ncbi:exopolyphosphatase [Rhodocyclus tenuis]|uniref:exopolyphosphatase n=1 Tax=Rhodocyclus gracilis TaxID=2929842 RepID=UPI001298E312|nr:exopolyphosphatase [Rhodocyclus gracilis]MRD71803.1 exopolyphosphatase [Rhodocyclus gracilis]